MLPFSITESCFLPAIYRTGAKFGSVPFAAVLGHTGEFLATTHSR